MNHIKFIFLSAFFLFCIAGITAQNDAETAALSAITIDGSKNTAYTFYYKNAKPVDVSQKEYDGLWEIQKEVIDNFSFDLVVFNKNKKSPYSKTPSKEDYYRNGRGISGDYANFFLLLAREKGLAENLYRINGKKDKDTHVWLEYRTKENAYIIDPTWSDDYPVLAQVRQQFKNSPAYGKRSFFTTYEEDKVIFHGHQDYNHSTYTVNQAEIWMF
jgi:hypothetical protein